MCSIIMHFTKIVLIIYSIYCFFENVEKNLEFDNSDKNN